MIPGRLEQQVRFILEVDRLKEIFRQTLCSRSRRPENDAEHSWHLCLAVIVLAEHADQQTRSALRENQGGLVEKLARHGIHLRTRVLEDRCRHLLKEPDHPTAGGRALQRLRRDLEWLEQWVEPHHHPVPGKPASAAA